MDVSTNYIHLEKYKFLCKIGDKLRLMDRNIKPMDVFTDYKHWETLSLGLFIIEKFIKVDEKFLIERCITHRHFDHTSTYGKIFRVKRMLYETPSDLDIGKLVSTETFDEEYAKWHKYF